jgi:hypothetical protein
VADREGDTPVHGHFETATGEPLAEGRRLWVQVLDSKRFGGVDEGALLTESRRAAFQPEAVDITLKRMGTGSG